MPNGLTDKMERFTLGLFSGKSQRQAYTEAGYSSRGLPATLDRVACDLANRSHIVARLAELRAEASSKLVMSVVERKERLSELGRGRIVDFLLENGAGIEVGRDSPNVGAVMELTTEQVGGGEPLSIIKTKVKLHNPIQAIGELNRMERIYEVGVTINQDNRVVNIYVQTERAKELLGQVKDRWQEVEGD